MIWLTVGLAIVLVCVLVLVLIQRWRISELESEIEKDKPIAAPINHNFVGTNGNWEVNLKPRQLKKTDLDKNMFGDLS